MSFTMKRRDFLKLGVGTVAVATVVANEAARQTTAPKTGAESVTHQDWTVEFNSVTAYVTKDTYDVFFSDRQRNHSPESFLDYLLSGTSMPRCRKVNHMQCSDNYDIIRVTLTGVVFASNTRHCPESFFAGYEHARFCLSSPNSKSGTHLTFSERAT